MTTAGEVTAFLRELVDAGLLLDCGVPGVFGRGPLFEDIVERFDAYVTRVGAPDAPKRVRFPPVLNRQAFERSGYMKNMPQLAGTIHSFEGAQKDHQELMQELEGGADWSHRQRITDVVLTPAACYPLYPTQKGELPAEGRLFDLLSYCFRHEPSEDPARMQSFRMREYVRLGAAEDVRSWRSRWLDRAQEMTRAAGLDAHIALANDPFFGRTGRMLAANQRDQELKYELVVPIHPGGEPTAIMSFNYHQDLFGGLYGISLQGSAAHTSCVGFGLERIALALLKKHGLKPEQWPKSVYDLLWP